MCICNGSWSTHSGHFQMLWYRCPNNSAVNALSLPVSTSDSIKSDLYFQLGENSFVIVNVIVNFRNATSRKANQRYSLLPHSGLLLPNCGSWCLSGRVPCLPSRGSQVRIQL